MGISLWTVAVQLHTIAGPILMLVYPLYASIMAIESPFKEDDTQWLTYWVLYSVFSLAELGFDPILSWIPMWYTFKLICIGWLVLPQFRGAAYVYDNYVRKYVGATAAQVDARLTPEQRHYLSKMSPESRNSVAQFIHENGPEAFDKIIQTATVTGRTVKPTPNGETQERY
ncbi:hypothetical protein R1sor_019069 [Riccia sorocarpa]|uniref:HVA22-like protein n=1 Tax=Riccia sorocarpa TaxID=122646 RepID=A0ABD3IE79_9MARC